MKKLLTVMVVVLALVLVCTGLATADEPYACPNCGQTVFVTVYDNDNCVEPTCTVKGYGHRVCANCGTEYEPQPYINVDPLGHEPGEPVVNEVIDPEPTCTTKGLKTITTTVTCMRDGCGEQLSQDVAYVDVDMIDHVWADEPEEVAGTRIGEKCVEAGSYEQAIFCTVCHAEKPGTREVVEVKALGHDPAEEVDENLVPSTCSENGSVDKVVYCNRCHIELSRRTVVLPLAEHIAADPVPELLQAATCMDYAKYDLVTKCKVCGFEMGRERNCDDADMVGTAHGTYYYPIPTTKREGLMDHDFSDLDESNKNYVAPTCYSEGTGVYWCSICGLKNEMRPIERLDHNYGPEYTVPATCMDKGAIMRECQNAGCKEAYDADPVDNASHYLVVEELDIDPNAHKWKLSPINEDADPGTEGHDEEEGSATRLPTCTKNGINAYVCEYNNAHRYAEKVPALGHDEKDIPAIKPTCVKVGYSAGTVCMREGCDGTAEALPDGYPEDNLPENYVKVIKAPSVIPAKGHVVLDYLVDDPEYKPATCTEDGTIVYKCAVCGERVVEEQKATGHDWFRVEDDDNPADCINGGYASFRCANCGDERREEIPATGEHQFGDWIEEPATCKSAGRIYRICNVCLYEDVQEFIPVDPEAHQWEIDWNNIKKYPSCTEAGLGAQFCQICGKTKYGIIDPTGHNPMEIAAIAPTCTEMGMTAGSVCEWCAEWLVEPEVIPALGHTPGDPVKENVVEPTETEPGSYDEVIYCTVCEAELSREKKEIPLPKNGLAQDEEGKWHYYKDDEIDTTKTGIVEFQGGEFWVVKGDLAEDANGLTICPDGKAYFLAQGQIQRKDGFAEYMGEWFIIKNGMLDETANGLYDYDGSQFVFAAGKLLKNVNGLWQNPKDDKWYFLANGQVQNYSGVAEYDGEFFVLKNGVLDSDYNGTIVYDGKTFNVVNGQLYDEVV